MPERHLGQSLGKYRVDALVGSGGFAWVYKAYDPELDIPLALKVLKPQYAGDERFEQRFRREASTAARLRHPNIVKIFAVGKEAGAVYFAMDYLPQGLADKLDVMTALPEPMLVRLGIDIASALGFAHREGVIHRDIKVDNILFDEHGNAVVADFGIARAVSNYVEQTGTNMVVGTPQYFSPEQARGQTLDGRADIYSLGVTLFRAATGVLPFQGEDWYEIARQHVEDTPPRPRTLNPGLSREVERAILRCLEKDPDDRYQTAEHLCQELAAVMRDHGGVSGARTLVLPPLDTLEASAQGSGFAAWRRRLLRAERRRLGAVAGVAVGLLALGGASAAYLANRGDAQPVSVPSVAPVAGPGTAVTSPVAAPAAALAPPVRSLAVSAPHDAALTVNGLAVGSGGWRSDTLPVGSYRLVATMKGAVGCPTLRAETSVTLGERTQRAVALTPRGCGLLRLDLKQPGGEYVVSGSGQAVRGATPVTRDILLPSGAYRVLVSKERCVTFEEADVRVVAGGTERVYVPPLLCQ